MFLKRSLNSNYFEYEIEQTKNKREEYFFDTFKLFNNNAKLDIKEYQIIINPVNGTMEIRIHMEKLKRCFSLIYDLERLMDDGECLKICKEYLYEIRSYAMSLCYKGGLNE